MVLKKQTNIRADFFPGKEQYGTQDAEPEPTTAAPSTENVADPHAIEADTRQEIAAGKIILVEWDGPDDPENPMNWPIIKKWTITGLLCAMCLFIGLATAAYGSGVTRMCKELNSGTSPSHRYIARTLADAL